jgi:FMNH2-dependent dimethyl sulfone monooxygenase
VAARIVEFKKHGVDLFLLGFLHFIEEVEYFGEKVLPIVRELEAEAVRRGELAPA